MISGLLFTWTRYTAAKATKKSEDAQQKLEAQQVETWSRAWQACVPTHVDLNRELSICILWQKSSLSYPNLYTTVDSIYLRVRGVANIMQDMNGLWHGLCYRASNFISCEVIATIFNKDWVFVHSDVHRKTFELKENTRFYII